MAFSMAGGRVVDSVGEGGVVDSVTDRLGSIYM